MHVIEARELVKTYGDGEAEVHALSGVDLAVEHGEFVAIMGPSGSGKSTLLNLLAGIEAPSSGRVLLDGTDLAEMDDRRRTLVRRRRIGLVFQSFNLLPAFTAEENVGMPLLLDGVGEAELRRRCRNMLDVVGLAHRLGHVPGTLSGGEQQRVAVARAMIIEPVLLLADEPTGNLDTASGRQITALLRQVVDQRKQTVVMVTHDPAVADRATALCACATAASKTARPKHAANKTRETDRQGTSQPAGSGDADAVEHRHRRGGGSCRQHRRRRLAAPWREMYESITGRAALEVVAASGGTYDQRVVTTIAETPGVAQAIPVFRQRTVLYADHARVRLLCLGIDPHRDTAIRDYKIVSGHFLDDAPGVLLPASLAQELGFHVGDEAKLLTRWGVRRFPSWACWLRGESQPSISAPSCLCRCRSPSDCSASKQGSAPPAWCWPHRPTRKASSMPCRNVCLAGLSPKGRSPARAWPNKAWKASTSASPSPSS